MLELNYETRPEHNIFSKNSVSRRIRNWECGIIWKVEEGEVGKKELFEFGMRNAECGNV